MITTTYKAPWGRVIIQLEGNDSEIFSIATAKPGEDLRKLGWEPLGK